MQLFIGYKFTNYELLQIDDGMQKMYKTILTQSLNSRNMISFYEQEYYRTIHLFCYCFYPSWSRLSRATRVWNRANLHKIRSWERATLNQFKQVHESGSPTNHPQVKSDFYVCSFGFVCLLNQQCKSIRLSDVLVQLLYLYISK